MASIRAFKYSYWTTFFHSITYTSMFIFEALLTLCNLNLYSLSFNICTLMAILSALKHLSHFQCLCKSLITYHSSFCVNSFARHHPVVLWGQLILHMITSLINNIRCCIYGTTFVMEGGLCNFIMTHNVSSSGWALSIECSPYTNLILPFITIIIALK
jgi:hypothetical protein